jgi:hypothetical protein
MQQRTSMWESSRHSGAYVVSGEATPGGSSPNHDNSGTSSHVELFSEEPVYDAQTSRVTNGSNQRWFDLEHEVSSVGAWGIPTINDAGVPRTVEEGPSQWSLEPLASLDEEEVEQLLYYALPSIRDNFVHGDLSMTMELYRNDQTLVGSGTCLSRYSAARPSRSTTVGVL